MALVDILMPVRDAEPWLPAALRSLRRQTLPDWRLLAVDDGSTDLSAAVLHEARRSDPRITVKTGPHRGVAEALNAALQASNAPFLVRMDADDLSAPRRLELLVEAALEAPWAGVVGSRVRLFPKRLVSANMDRYVRWQNDLLSPTHLRRERYVESTLTHATALFRRTALAMAAGWRQGPYPEDLDLWLRLHQQGVAFLKRPEVLYLWREHKGRETRSSPRCSDEAFHVCRASHLVEELRGMDATRIAVMGPEGARRRWSESLLDAVFEVDSLAWSGRTSPPSGAKDSDFTLACFGAPEARGRARKRLYEAGWVEEEQYLFVG